MSTLNYWLGKLQRLQLFGYGVLPLKVITVLEGGEEREFEVVDARLIDGVVYIEVE